MLEPFTISCPYCGESFETLVDDSAGEQNYIEDCVVCCRPIEFRLNLAADGTLNLEVKRDDD
ncbi:MAG: CPXCG motif-containing cysteine-rich protein [Gammaproteobacteria bacterium]